MKKRRILLTMLFLFIVTSAYFSYRYYYPKMIADAIVNKKYIPILPQSYQEKALLFTDTLNYRLDQVIQTTENAGISFDQLLAAIDEVDKKEAESIYKILSDMEIYTVEQVFDTVQNNIVIQSFDTELLREAVNKHVQIQHIKKALRFTKRHKLFENIDEESGKKIAKEILIQKKEKVLKKLSNTNP